MTELDECLIATNVAIVNYQEWLCFNLSCCIIFDHQPTNNGLRLVIMKAWPQLRLSLHTPRFLLYHSSLSLEALSTSPIQLLTS